MAAQASAVSVELLQVVVGEEAARPQRNVQSTGGVPFGQDEIVFSGHHRMMKAEQDIKSGKISPDVTDTAFIMHFEQTKFRHTGHLLESLSLVRRESEGGELHWLLGYPVRKVRRRLCANVRTAMDPNVYSMIVERHLPPDNMPLVSRYAEVVPFSKMVAQRGFAASLLFQRQIPGAPAVSPPVLPKRQPPRLAAPREGSMRKSSRRAKKQGFSNTGFSLCSRDCKSCW
jgi:hypothetical protein